LPQHFCHSKFLTKWCTENERLKPRLLTLFTGISIKARALVHQAIVTRWLNNRDWVYWTELFWVYEVCLTSTRNKRNPHTVIFSSLCDSTKSWEIYSAESGSSQHFSVVFSLTKTHKNISLHPGFLQISSCLNPVHWTFIEWPAGNVKITNITNSLTLKLAV
jgi:hypothetical protein